MKTRTEPECSIYLLCPLAKEYEDKVVKLEELQNRLWVENTMLKREVKELKDFNKVFQKRIFELERMLLKLNSEFLSWKTTRKY